VGKLDGKVALITGAARGQGRSHAVRLAADGADIIGVDLCAQVPSVTYPMSSPEDLDETAALVKAHNRRFYHAIADVRDFGQLSDVVSAGVAELGGLNIVVANAGICIPRSVLEPRDVGWWDDVIAVNLTGVWHTVRAALDHLVAGGEGSIILISSTAGIRGLGNLGSYAAAKHGVIGLGKCLAIELGPLGIRANCVLPGPVDTPMNNSQMTFNLMRPDLEHPTQADVEDVFRSLQLLPTPWLDPAEVSNAVSWLASDESRWVTGISLSVDAGAAAK
jgi:(+)-trans-carveol dehydrogenase